MLKLTRILVTAHALVGGAAMLTACGQTGPLVLPDSPASAKRATLPQSLNPWHTAPAARPATAPLTQTEPPSPTAPSAPAATPP
ncbi:lipoprotein [Limnohabitans sp.]|uniref:LPS translocon maturation chaperone LptM n=1 Tax=Limnohabitans sp. TaxID=1907725 RepID=UPI0037BFAC2F